MATAVCGMCLGSEWSFLPSRCCSSLRSTSVGSILCVWLCVWARAHAWHYVAHALCRASLLPVDLHMIVRQSFLAQNAVTCAVYAKCLSVGPAVLQEATVGKVTNLMSTDARKMQQFVMVSGAIRVARSLRPRSFVFSPMCRATISCSTTLGFRPPSCFAPSRCCINFWDQRPLLVSAHCVWPCPCRQR